MDDCNYWGWQAGVSRTRRGRVSAGWTAEGVRPYAPCLCQSRVRLLAHRGVAQAVFAGEVDLTGDQAVVVDTTGHGVAGTGIGDVFEDSIFVNEADGGIG